MNYRKNNSIKHKQRQTANREQHQLGQQNKVAHTCSRTDDATAAQNTNKINKIKTSNLYATRNMQTDKQQLVRQTGRAIRLEAGTRRT